MFYTSSVQSPRELEWSPLRRGDPSMTGKRLHRTIIEAPSTGRGLESLTRCPSPAPGRQAPDFMKQLFRSELAHSKSMSQRSPVPLRPITPLVGRSPEGCLRLFMPEQASTMGTAGPGGWIKQPSYDGMSSYQRALPPVTSRFGPGPAQTMIFGSPGPLHNMVG